MAIHVQSADDARLDDYRTLRDPELRKRYENRRGVFIAEGPNVVRELVRSSYAVKSVLVATEREAEMADALAALPDDVDVFVADREVVMDVVAFRMHQGVVAVGWRPTSQPGLAEVLAHARRVAVLEEMNDTTNLGALFRTCRALGVDAVVLGPRCSDPLYRRAVRVSMGHVLHVPWTVAPLDEVRTVAADLGITTIALVADDADVTVDDLAAAPPPRAALFVGAEGPGLTAESIAACDVRATIPMAPGVDSLNVTVAAAIALHALPR